MSFNGMNPAVRRIFREIAEIRAELLKNSSTPEGCFCALEAVNDNLFELHFTIRGPPGTPFELGCYHGKLILPHDYPFKPPEITFLTPSGRFEVKKKICLSISDYHPELWQPAWGLRTVLIGISSFMAAESAGAIGSLSWSAEERARLAVESLGWKCPDCDRKNSEILPGAGQKYIVKAADAQASGLCFEYSKSPSDDAKSNAQPPSAPDSSVADTAPNDHSDTITSIATNNNNNNNNNTDAAAATVQQEVLQQSAPPPPASPPPPPIPPRSRESEAERLQHAEEIRRRTQETRTLRSRVDFLIFLLLAAVLFKLFS